MSKISQKQNKTQLNATDSVDQIRNILFGEQIKVFENKFTELENKLTMTIENLSNRVDSAIKELNIQIDKSKKQSQTEHSELAKQNEKDILSLESTLNNKITETESDLLNQIQSGLEKLDSKASHRNELAQLLKDMADKLSN